MKLGISLQRNGVLMYLLVIALALNGCMRSPEAKAAAFIESGKKLLQKNETKRAVLEFRNAAQATPKNPEIYYQLGLAYLASGDLRSGVASLRKALDLNPKHHQAQLRLAQLMTNASDQEVLKDAQQRLQKLLVDAPGDADALHALALTELKLGDTDDAVQNLERAVSSAPQELVFAVTLAEAKLAQRDSKGAEAILKKACDDFPKSADAAVILGRFYALQSKTAEAEQQLRRALSIDPKHGGALLNLATLEIKTGRSAGAENVLKQLSSRTEEMFKPLYGNFLFQQGRRGEAVLEFERLAKRDPDDRMARTRLIAAYQSAGRLPDAQKVLSDALKKNAKDLDALLQRGELFVQAGKYDEAEADLNNVLRLKPDSPEVHYALAKLHHARGALLRERGDLTTVLVLNSRLLQARMDLAGLLIKQNAGQMAIDTLNQAPQDQKGRVAFIEQKNWAFLSIGQAAEARKSVDSALAVVRTPTLLLQDAILKIDAKHYPEARVSVHELLAKNPADLRALRVLVRSYALQGQVRTAVDEVRAHATAHPQSPDIQYFLGNLLLETGNRAQAKQALAAAKKIKPDYAPADMSLARIDLLQSNWSDARQELTSILAAKSDNQMARQWLGMLEVAAGDRAAAIADFRKVTDAEPNNAFALNNLAYLLVESGNQTDEPLKFAEKAVELDPANPEFEDTLGWVLYRRAAYDLAVKHLESSISKKPSAIRNYHLAMAYARAGKVEHGRVALEAALSIDSSLPEAKIAKEVFRTAGGSSSTLP